ncbi:MAG TPA: NAD-dependent epimerase/dehydratase family protein [Candidatus Rubrimentiphilum sp.]|nr:NAD-dependent epimerase/dehydratase family protein [Candidatus Rubrimentiphilum sp.]
MRGSSVLVTGGAGFIGSHLTDALLAGGCSVTVLDDFSSGERENLELAQQSGRLRIVEGSVLEEGDLTAAMRGVTHVFHLAVQCVRRSLGKPVENHEVNATGTILTLEAARRAGVRRFIYCSSSEVYGNCGGDRLHEDDTSCAPVTVYGAAKLAGEYYTGAYHQTYALQSVIVRPFNSYGPREHDQGDLAEVIPRFVIRALNGLPPIIFGDGEGGRDFTYVTETAAGIALAAECDALLGRVVNLAYGRMITINEVAAAVLRACGRTDLVPQHIDPRPGDVIALQADTTRAREVLNFRAHIDFEQGLQKYLQWFRGRYPDPAALLEERPQNWELPV